MDANAISTMIASLGFPIVCCLGMGWFILKFYKDYTTDSKANMEAVQARCKEREEKLFEEIKLNREVNAQAISTIALYADRLDSIQHDVSEIKSDINLLMHDNKNN